MSFPPESKIEYHTLKDLITKEIVDAFGLSSVNWQRKILARFFSYPADRLARLLITGYQDVESSGMPMAASNALPRFLEGVKIFGAQNIPKEGPLLIASNHPGAYDGLIILANMPRNDIYIVISDVPLIRNLPAIDRQMIYTFSGTQGRMSALRGILRQLQNGSAVLIFPSGLVDPDPDLMPGAKERLQIWSPSLELILRKVPDTIFQVTVVSSVLAESCIRNPLTRLQKEKWRQQKLAEFIQVIQQVLLNRKFNLVPRISFAEPAHQSQLIEQQNSPGLMQGIIHHAENVLASHLCRPESNWQSVSYHLSKTPIESTG